MSQLKRPKIGPKSSKKLVSDAEITTAPQCLSVTSSAASVPLTSSDPRPIRTDFIDLTDTDDEVIEVLANQIPNKNNERESSCANTAQTIDKTQAIIPPNIESVKNGLPPPLPRSPFPSLTFRLPRPLSLTSSEPRPTTFDFIDLTDTGDEVIEVFANQIPNINNERESSCTNTAQTSDKTQAIIPPDIEPLPIDCLSPTPLSPFPSSTIRLSRPLPVPSTSSEPRPTIDCIDLTDTDDEVFIKPVKVYRIAFLPALPMSPLPVLFGPPKPIIKIINLLKTCIEDPVSKSGIMLTWNMANVKNLPIPISKFHVYVYEEGDENSEKIWKKFGDFDAHPLPMGCTIKMIKKGINYYFVVRAQYQNMTIGQFSVPACLNLNVS